MEEQTAPTTTRERASATDKRDKISMNFFAVQTLVLTVAFSLATLSRAVAGALVPAVALGTWELTSSSDPDWTFDTYTQLEDGTFTGNGYGWDSSSSSQYKYTYYGATTESLCAKKFQGSQPSDALVVVQSFWYVMDYSTHPSSSTSSNQKIFICSYTSYDQSSAIVRRRSFENLLSASTTPGHCPASLEDAQSNGIAWLSIPAGSTSYTDTYKCVRDCKPLQCDDDSGSDESKKLAAVGAGVACGLFALFAITLFLVVRHYRSRLYGQSRVVLSQQPMRAAPAPVILQTMPPQQREA